MKLNKVVIIGVGLIGGSIGKALLKKKLAKEVVGVCRRQSSLDRAISERAFSKGYINDPSRRFFRVRRGHPEARRAEGSYEDAVKDADLIFIATPVHTIKSVLKDLSKVIRDKRTLVTDVGSTKLEIVSYAARFKNIFSFVGGHPLAGSEKSGVENSTAKIFHDSICILTKGKHTSRSDLKMIQKIWEAIGAKVFIATPKDHDRKIAFSSHLPHAVAYALAGVLDKNFPKEMIGTGFKDTTRIASSDPILWNDIFIDNRDNVLMALERFKDILSGLTTDIRKKSKKSLETKLSNYKRKRDEVF